MLVRSAQLLHKVLADSSACIHHPDSIPVHSHSPRMTDPCSSRASGLIRHNKHSKPPINQVQKPNLNFFGVEESSPSLCWHRQCKSCGERDSPVTVQEWGVGAEGSWVFPHLGAGGVSQRMPKELASATGRYFVSSMQNPGDEERTVESPSLKVSGWTKPCLT